jgi:hypothetical protein
LVKLLQIFAVVETLTMATGEIVTVGEEGKTSTLDFELNNYWIDH